MNKVKNLLLLLALLTSAILNAQIRTTIYPNGDAFRFRQELQNVSSNNIPNLDFLIININEVYYA